MFNQFFFWKQKSTDGKVRAKRWNSRFVWTDANARTRETSQIEVRSPTFNESFRLSLDDFVSANNFCVDCENWRKCVRDEIRHRRRFWLSFSNCATLTRKRKSWKLYSKWVYAPTNASHTNDSLPSSTTSSSGRLQRDCNYSFLAVPNQSGTRQSTALKTLKNLRLVSCVDIFRAQIQWCKWCGFEFDISPPTKKQLRNHLINGIS